MILLTPELRAALIANDRARRSTGGERFDPPPLVKLFSPLGTATWLASELGDDGDTLFGLVDLGFGCPELGSFSLAEIARIRLPFGLAIERDIAFATDRPLSAWVDATRRSGSIIAAEIALRRASPARPELPPPSHHEERG